MPAHIINEGIVSGGMFIAIGESIIARVAALGGYISFSLIGCPKTPYQHVLEMVSKPKNAVGDRHLAAKSMHLATNLEFGRSHQMSVVACSSNASSAECNISVYFFPVPSTRCAHHACSNLIYSCFHSNIHALRVFLVCISWIRVGYST